MTRFSIRSAAALVLVIIFSIPLTVLAHHEVTAGKYTLEIGWLNEPPLLGVANAVFISIVNSDTGQPVEGADRLQVTIETGDKNKDLQLHPLGEAAPGQYAADFIPTAWGQYTVNLSGYIETDSVDLSQIIEDVELPQDYQFPVALPSMPEMDQKIQGLQEQLTQSKARADEAEAQTKLAQNLAIGALAFGLIGTGLGAVSVLRQKKA